MDRDTNFESYLLISPEKLIISVLKKKTLENIYQKEKVIDIENEKINYDIIDNFLSQNIFSIEKILKNFIKKINLIIVSEDFFPIEISLRNNNHGKLISQKNLTYLLNEAKDQCKKTFQDKKIIHLLIKNYLIDDHNYNFLPDEIKCNFFSIDIKFICFPNDLVKIFEEVLSKYHISVNRFLSADYLDDYFDSKDIDIFNRASQIIDGCNLNEVKIIDKIPKKSGFFERFFNIFS
tara:strand:- start:130 stop:834 length:705 start_codon:yes stop_codon:yes gene_type:complete